MSKQNIGMNAEQLASGVYSRMYQALLQHQLRLMSFQEMRDLWLKEARLVKQFFFVEHLKQKQGDSMREGDHLSLPSAV